MLELVVSVKTLSPAGAKNFHFSYKNKYVYKVYKLFYITTTCVFLKVQQK